MALRYGYFYGPGTTISLGPEGTLVQAIRKRQLPLVGNATGVWPFVHIEDAAEATVQAIEGHGAGIYHVVDDEPGGGRRLAAGDGGRGPSPRPVAGAAVAGREGFMSGLG